MDLDLHQHSHMDLQTHNSMLVEAVLAEIALDLLVDLVEVVMVR